MNWDVGVNFLNIEVDSTLVIICLTFPGDMAPAFAPLICDCWILVARDWTVALHHTYHEASGVADRLAKRGREQSNQLEIYAQCSSFVSCNCMWNLWKKCTPRESSMIPFVNRHQLHVSNGHT